MKMPTTPGGDGARETEHWIEAGRLLRGAAHEVNNHLGAILAYAELIAASPRAGDDLRLMARETAAAARESASLLGVLAVLASTDLETVESVSLRDVVRHCCSLFRIELERRGQGIALSLPESPCLVQGVSARIVRAIVGALRYASEIRGEGKISVRMLEHPDAFVLEVDLVRPAGPARVADLPAELMESREHARYHRGDLHVSENGRVWLEIPRATRPPRAD